MQCSQHIKIQRGPICFVFRYYVEVVGVSVQVTYKSIECILVKEEQKRIPLLSMGYYWVQSNLEEFFTKTHRVLHI